MFGISQCNAFFALRVFLSPMKPVFVVILWCIQVRRQPHSSHPTKKKKCHDTSSDIQITLARLNT